MVNTALRGARLDYAWFEALVHPGSMGSPLYFKRRMHVADSSGAISHDFVPARFVDFYTRSLVANWWAWPTRHADGAADFLDSSLVWTPEGLSLPGGKRELG